MTTVKGSMPVIVAIGVLVLVACCLLDPWDHSAGTSPFYDKNRDYVTESFEECTGKNDIQRFKSIPHLVLFLDNDFALQARQSRIAIVQLHKSVQRRPQLASVQFWRVANDLSGTEFFDAISAWLTGQDADTVGHTGGNGGVYWVSYGKVVATVPYAYEGGYESLLQITLRVFSPEALD